MAVATRSCRRSTQSPRGSRQTHDVRQNFGRTNLQQIRLTRLRACFAPPLPANQESAHFGTGSQRRSSSQPSPRTSFPKATDVDIQGSRLTIVLQPPDLVEKLFARATRPLLRVRMERSANSCAPTDLLAMTRDRGSGGPSARCRQAGDCALNPECRSAARTLTSLH
jgi:hypothetical protein